MVSQHDRHFKPGTMLFPLRKYLSGPQHHFLDAYLKPGISALDLGSGPGFFTIRMSEQIGSNGIVYAVDGDETAVARLRERSDNLSIKNIRAFVSSATDIPFVQTGSIDVLFSNGLLCCMLGHNFSCFRFGCYRVGHAVCSFFHTLWLCGRKCRLWFRHDVCSIQVRLCSQ